MIQEHATAIKALLSAGTMTGRTVYDTRATTDGPPNYLVFFLTTPDGQSRRLTADAPRLGFLLSTMYVGSTPREVRDLADKAAAELVGKQLVVTGRRCSPFVRPGRPNQVRYDDTVKPPAYVATDVWPFTSDAAS
jgi:hypothetical protein